MPFSVIDLEKYDINDLIPKNMPDGCFKGVIEYGEQDFSDEYGQDWVYGYTKGTTFWGTNVVLGKIIEGGTIYGGTLYQLFKFSDEISNQIIIIDGMTDVKERLTVIVESLMGPSVFKLK